MSTESANPTGNRRAAPWAAGVIAAALLLLPSSAVAFPEHGAISQLPSPNNCVGEAGPALCGTTVGSGLAFAYQSVVSPDGRNLYSVAINGALIEYGRDTTTGALTVIGCIVAAGPGPPCAPEHEQQGITVMQSPAAIAISPDGKSVYVLDQAKSMIVELSRNQETGILTVVEGEQHKPECVTEEAALCETTNAKGLSSPYGLTVSPDGTSVYVASFSEQIAELERNTSTGALKEIVGHECIGGASSGCPDHEAIGLKEDIGILVSPDGKDLYVAAGAKEATGDVAGFERNTSTGVLKQLAGAGACSSEGVPGCEKAMALQGSEDLAISPDGANVYATSFPTNAIIDLKREASGALKQLTGSAGCISTTVPACKQVVGIGGPIGVAVSPDGADVYVDGFSQGTLAAFKREGGLLNELAEHQGCLTSETGLCGAGFEALQGFQGARRLTVSPDGTNVYVAAQSGGAIAEVNRAEEPAVTSVSPTVGSEAGGQTIQIKGRGFVAGARVTFGSPETEALEVTVNSSESISAVTPPTSAPSKESVDVSTYAGKSEEQPGSYTTTTPAAPTVTAVAPRYGSIAGGTEVEVLGSEFLDGASEVLFAGKAASSVTYDSPTSLRAIAPPGVEGATVDLSVKTPHGTSANTPADHYRYSYEPPKPLGGLDLAGYCSTLGYSAVTLLRGGVEGPGYAFENWACEGGKATAPITPTGPAPSMQGACAVQHPGVASFAYAVDPDDANSWNCFEAAPEAPRSPPAKGAEHTPAKTAATTHTTPSVAPPVAGRSGDAAPVSGRVLLRLPGAKGFVALATLSSIPFGTVIDATHGRVVITTVGPHGTQVAEFFEGQFILQQGAHGVVTAELSGGDFAVCPTARERAHRASAELSASRTSRRHVVRKLWADAHGSYSTKGNYAAGAVQGTEWLTEDLCDGTLIKVTRDKVKVTNLVHHKTLIVKVGHQYLAQAP